MSPKNKNSVLQYLRVEQERKQLETQIDQQALQNIEAIVGTTLEIEHIREGKKASGSYNTATEIGARPSDWLPTTQQIRAVNYDEFDGMAENVVQAKLESQKTQLIVNDWVVGTDKTDFFIKFGEDAVNPKVMGLNHKNESCLLWNCQPTVANSATGWETIAFNIDKSKAYRFTVFIKTTNNYGTTSFGCKASSVCSLTTTTKIANPLFLTGDLPANNKWYLLAGYVFASGQTGLSNIGGIYDCETGAKVANLTNSFRWASDAIQGTHRCFHVYNSGSPISSQTMYWPRVDLIDGNEPSILNLIGNLGANAIKYSTGVTVDSLRPAEAGANITETRVSADTSKVNGTSASVVTSNATSGKNAMTKIQNEVGSATIETTAGADIKVSALSNTVTSLTNRITSLENRVVAIENQPVSGPEKG